MRPERTGLGQDKKSAQTVPSKNIYCRAGVRFGPDLAPCAWTVIVVDLSPFPTIFVFVQEKKKEEEEKKEEGGGEEEKRSRLGNNIVEKKDAPYSQTIGCLRCSWQRSMHPWLTFAKAGLPRSCQLGLSRAEFQDGIL